MKNLCPILDLLWAKPDRRRGPVGCIILFLRPPPRFVEVRTSDDISVWFGLSGGLIARNRELGAEKTPRNRCLGHFLRETP